MDRVKWIKSVQKKHECMVEDGILQVADTSQIEKEANTPILLHELSRISQGELIGQDQ